MDAASKPFSQRYYDFGLALKEDANARLVGSPVRKVATEVVCAASVVPGVVVGSLGGGLVGVADTIRDAAQNFGKFVVDARRSVYGSIAVGVPIAAVAFALGTNPVVWAGLGVGALATFVHPLIDRAGLALENLIHGTMLTLSGAFGKAIAPKSSRPGEIASDAGDYVKADAAKNDARGARARRRPTDVPTDRRDASDGAPKVRFMAPWTPAIAERIAQGRDENAHEHYVAPAPRRRATPVAAKNEPKTAAAESPVIDAAAAPESKAALRKRRTQETPAPIEAKPRVRVKQGRSGETAYWGNDEQVKKLVTEHEAIVASGAAQTAKPEPTRKSKAARAANPATVATARDPSSPKKTRRKPAGERAAGQEIPRKPAQRKAAPDETTPPKAALGETTPPKAAPGETAPPKAAPGETTPPKAAPGETTPPKAAPGETAPHETAQGKTRVRNATARQEAAASQIAVRASTSLPFADEVAPQKRSGTRGAPRKPQRAGAADSVRRDPTFSEIDPHELILRDGDRREPTLSFDAAAGEIGARDDGRREPTLSFDAAAGEIGPRDDGRREPTLGGKRRINGDPASQGLASIGAQPLAAATDDRPIRRREIVIPELTSPPPSTSPSRRLILDEAQFTADKADPLAGWVTIAAKRK